MTTESQNAAILRHLQKGKSITAIEALKKFDCFRLASRIHDLRKNNEHNIISKRVTNSKLKKTFASYRMVIE